MIPENVFQQILMLGEEWKVQAVEYQDKERQIVIKVSETSKLWLKEKWFIREVGVWSCVDYTALV